MKTISTEETLRRLEARPDLAAQFDAAHPGTDRRTAVQSVLNALGAKQAALASSNETKRQALRAAKELEKAAAAMKASRDARRSVTKPAAPRPAVASRPAPSSPAAQAPTPAPETAREKYKRLQSTAPHEAGKFWEQNKADILYPNRITKQTPNK
jgi:hypothetical protein